jgi:AcrR family transcriptional regulator
MPRVSDAHREQRRQQILDAARRRFARNGFHQTSIQDILTEGNLSAGALYRYFRSKEEIIAAIAEDALRQVTAPIGQLTKRQPLPPLDAAIEQLLTNAEDFGFRPDGFAYIGPQVWAEALRNPQLRELVQDRFAEVRNALAGVVRAEQAAGRIPADADADGVAGFLFGSLLGYVIQRVLAGTVDPKSYSAALGALTGG